MSKTPTVLILFIGLLVAVGDATPLIAAAPRGDRLEKILVGRNDVSRLRTLQAVDQDFAARLEALPELCAALSELAGRVEDDDRDKPLQPGVAKLITTVAKIDRPEAVEALTDALTAPATDWLAVTANELGRNRQRAAIPALVKTFRGELCSGHYGSRFAIVRALLQMKHPDAIEALGRIRASIDGQLHHKLDVELKKVTLEDFLDDEARFEKWTSGEYLTQPLDRKFPEDSMFKNASFSPSINRIKLTPTKYYDIDIHAKRLLFVIDRSGSMSEMGYRGTRLQKAKRELIGAIRRLDQDTEFGILVFDTHVRAYKDELQYASDENKTKAIKYVTSLQAGERTNTYGALRKAIEFDDQLEAIFVLTDGRPTTGPIVPPQQILSDILQRNKVRNISINTVAIAVDLDMQGFLKGLTEPSGGEFRAIE